MTDLGTAHGNVVINAAPALAALAALRRENASTIGAMNTTGRAAQTAGAGLIGMGALIVAGFSAAVKKSAELEKKLSYISGITNITAGEMDKLREKVIQLGQDSAYTAGEVADGFTELAKAGATTEQMIGGMGDAMITLGQAADIPLDKAATALVSISSTFGLAASESSRIADIMSGAANASIISVEDMAVSFKYAGGVAANLGVSLEDTATAIALLGNAGIKGSTAGTSLRRIFLQLTPRTKKAADVMKELGLITKDGANQFYDAQGKAKKLSDVVQILHDSLKGLNPEQQQKALATIFGDRAINSAIALSKGGAAAFNEMNDALGRSSAADVAAKRLDNLSGAIEILKGTIDSALIRAGAPAQKPLQRIVQLITKIVNVFNNLPGPVQQAIVYFLLAFAAITLLAGGFLMTFGTILRAGAVMKQLGDAFRVFGPLVRQVITLIRLLSVALLTSPIFWIIVAVVALAVGFYLLYKRSETFRKGVQAVGKALEKAFHAVINWFKDFPKHMEDAWNATKRFFSKIGSAIKDAFVDAFNAVIGWVKDNWDILLLLISGPIGLAVIIVRRFGDDIVNFFKGIGKRVAGWASGIWDKFMGDAKSIPEAIGYWLGFALGKIVRFFIDAGKAAWNGAQTVFWAIIHFFTALPGTIWGWLKSAWNAISTFFVDAYHSAVSGGGNFLSAVGSFFSQLPGRIKNFLVSAYHAVVSWAGSMLSKAREMGSNFLSAVGSFFSQLPGRVMGWITGAYHAVTGFIGRFFSAGRDIGSSIVNGITGFITGLPGTVMGIIGRVIDAFKGMVSKAFNAAKDFAGGLWNGFKDGLGINSPSFIEKQMFQIQDEGENTIGALGKQVRTLQRLGATVPSVAPSSALTGSAAAVRTSFSAPSARRDDSTGEGDGSFVFAPTINNPKKERASTTVHREMQKVAYHDIPALTKSRSTK